MNLVEILTHRDYGPQLEACLDEKSRFELWGVNQVLFEKYNMNLLVTSLVWKVVGTKCIGLIHFKWHRKDIAKVYHHLVEVCTRFYERIIDGTGVSTWICDAKMNRTTLQTKLHTWQYFGKRLREELKLRASPTAGESEDTMIAFGFKTQDDPILLEVMMPYIQTEEFLSILQSATGFAYEMRTTCTTADHTTYAERYGYHDRD